MRKLILLPLLLVGCAAGPVKKVTFVQVKPDHDQVGVCEYHRETKEVFFMSPSDYKKMMDEVEQRRAMQNHSFMGR